MAPFWRNRSLLSSSFFFMALIALLSLGSAAQAQQLPRLPSALEFATPTPTVPERVSAEQYFVDEVMSGVDFRLCRRQNAYFSSDGHKYNVGLAEACNLRDALRPSHRMQGAANILYPVGLLLAAAGGGALVGGLVGDSGPDRYSSGSIPIRGYMLLAIAGGIAGGVGLLLLIPALILDRVADSRFVEAVRDFDLSASASNDGASVTLGGRF